MSEERMRTTESLTAVLEPDCYGGSSCDEIIHRWKCHADGDRESDYEKILTIDARIFPPGTMISVCEPICPRCEERRYPREDSTEEGPFFSRLCPCGFDWNGWVKNEYS